MRIAMIDNIIALSRRRKVLIKYTDSLNEK